MNFSFFVGIAFLFCTVSWAIPTKPVVSVLSLKKSELSDSYTFPARVVPRKTSTVLAETDGVVSDVFVSLGQRVYRGQKILRVQHTDPVYQYAPVSAVSAISGVVGQIEVTPGTHVAKGQRLVSIVDPSNVHLTVEIPSQDVRQFRPGLKGVFVMAQENHAGSKSSALTVVIRGISPNLDPLTGTSTCEITFEQKTKPDPDLLPMPGTIGQVLFHLNQHTGFAVLDHAIVYKGKDTFIRVLENSKQAHAKFVQVRLGKKQKGIVEVAWEKPDGTMSSNPDLLLIERSSRFIADGEEVSIQPEEKK